ncbi:MAG: DUF3179 domain-containing protein [Dehalococcoidales bacterium]|nr:MAG: DUF3179 domain-containing protein [Dehalococcoidales bacterium]
MRGGRCLSLIILILVLVLSSCSNDIERISGEQNRSLITDRTGRNWDVTYARDNYGMNPDYYNFGLGIGVINSIDNPEIIREGNRDYPEEDDSFIVFGVNHNGEQRAYSVASLARHEVYNDLYPGTAIQHVAVTF